MRRAPLQVTASSQRINNLWRSVLPPRGCGPAVLWSSGARQRLVLICTAVPSGGAGVRTGTRGGPGAHPPGTPPSSSPAAAGVPSDRGSVARPLVLLRSGASAGPHGERGTG